MESARQCAKERRVRRSQLLAVRAGDSGRLRPRLRSLALTWGRNGSGSATQPGCLRKRQWVWWRHESESGQSSGESTGFQMGVGACVQNK